MVITPGLDVYHIHGSGEGSIIVREPEVPAMVILVRSPAVPDKPRAVPRSRSLAEILCGESIIPADQRDDMIAVFLSGIVIGIVSGAVIFPLRTINRADRTVIYNGCLHRGGVFEADHAHIRDLKDAGTARGRVGRVAVRPSVRNLRFLHRAEHICGPQGGIKGGTARLQVVGPVQHDVVAAAAAFFIQKIVIGKIGQMQLGEINVRSGVAVMDQIRFHRGNRGKGPAGAVGPLVSHRRKHAELEAIVIYGQDASSLI